MKKRLVIETSIFLILLCPGSAWSQHLATASSLDSLDLKILENRIEKARLRVSESAFLRRLIPRIQTIASFGLKDVVFIDPLTADPYLLPQDSFRLTISLSVTDILDFTPQEIARLELSRLEMERRKASIKQARRRDALKATVAGLERHLELLREELPLKARLVNYRELLFHQGKSDYDTLIRARLQLLSLKRSILELAQRIDDLRRGLD